MEGSNSVQVTERFLQCLARRLSGREDLRYCNYQVIIDSNGSVTVSPLIYVYPNRYRRKESDRIEISKYILDSFPELMYYDLVPGNYIYQSSSDNKRRRWVRETK